MLYVPFDCSSLMMARLSTNDLPSIGLLIYGVWRGLVYEKLLGNQINTCIAPKHL